MFIQTQVRGVLALDLLLFCSGSAAMTSAKRPCLLTPLIFFLLVSTVHGAQLVADANGAGADGKRVTAREGVAGGHAHGYSSHSTHNPNGAAEDGGGGGTPAVDPRNLAARGHPHGGAASRALGHPRLAACGVLGAAFLAVLL